jgi:hypothetical protein
MAEIKETVFIKRVPEPGSNTGWVVSVIRAVGPHKGQEKVVAMLCGGNVGKALAALCGRHVAETMMIDDIVIDTELATTED